MSATSVKLLQAAADILGGNEELAAHLGVDEWLLDSYLADRRVLPDALLLRAVDVVLADRRVNLPEVSGVTENDGRGSGAATAAGAGGA